MQQIVAQDERDGRDILGSYVHWEGEVDISANAALAAGIRAGKGDDDRSTMADAERFLREKLASGPVSAKEGEEHAHAIGISRRTLMRARKKLKVVAEKIDMTKGWTWRLLPDEECQS
jgi:hypothetical protein